MTLLNLLNLKNRVFWVFRKTAWFGGLMDSAKTTTPSVLESTDFGQTRGSLGQVHINILVFQCLSRARPGSFRSSCENF